MQIPPVPPRDPKPPKVPKAKTPLQEARKVPGHCSFVRVIIRFLRPAVMELSKAMNMAAASVLEARSWTTVLTKAGVSGP